MEESEYPTHAQEPWPSAMALVAKERARQIEKGYTTEHDDQIEVFVFNAAGMAYYKNDSSMWPFDEQYFHPRGHFRNLIRAAALFLAGAGVQTRRWPDATHSRNLDDYYRMLPEIDRMLWEVSEAVGGPVEKREQ